MLQKNTSGAPCTRDTRIIRLADNLGVMTIAPYGESIIHVAIFPSEPFVLPMWGVTAAPDASVKVEITDTESGYTFTLPNLEAQVDRATGKVSFSDARGRRLTELTGYGLSPAEVSGESTFRVSATFVASDDESYYGLGQHQFDMMDQRGRAVRVWHDYHGENGEGESIGVPFLVTNKHYGVIFDNPSRTTCTPGVDAQTAWTSEVGDALSFFVVSGDTADDIYFAYRTLTGETPMPPKSALGYIQCKQRYRTQDEMLAVARKQREKGYPCDIFVVDWDHWKVRGDLDLDTDYWPDAAAMCAEMKSMNLRVMMSIWPRFMKESRHYDALESRGWFMKDAEGNTVYGIPEDQRGAVIDTTNPDAGEYYWNAVREGYATKGFTSWWTDENEPDVCPYPFYLHAGTGARVTNIYPLTHTRAVYEGHRRDMPERCLILSRSAYLGAQSNGTTFWSSDISATWDFYRRQIPAGLNFCATGFAYWSSDIGGWQPLPEKPERVPVKVLLDPEPAREIIGLHDDYPELYVRWFQYGSFCPTFRAHGTRKENEVWSFGPEAEKILVKYLKLRYRLMPYIYSLAHNNNRTGAPFMRSLWMDFPNDPNVRDIRDQYMFGPAFLVAPVTAQAAESREVYLPAGASWYNFWTGEMFDGGRSITVDAPIDTLPLFVKAGSVIPVGESIQHTDQKQKNIELHVYPGADASFDLYDDDGTTYAYEQGDFSLTSIKWNNAAGKIEITGDKAGLFSGSESQWLKIVARG